MSHGKLTCIAVVRRDDPCHSGGSRHKLQSGMRYLLIDAHNVICADEALRERLHRDQDGARDRLAAEALAVHDAEGVRVALILDSRNHRLEVLHPFGKKTFEYLYAPADLTADGVIERILRRSPTPETMTVVSNDNYVREATRAVGGMALRPQEFFDWAAACARRLSEDARRRQAESEQSFRNGLDIPL